MYFVKVEVFHFSHFNEEGTSLQTLLKKLFFLCYSEFQFTGFPSSGPRPSMVLKC